jgi:NAD(P)-dependent dehydrogenase (short-subunit alcohol dehydrogenase family)
VTSLAGRHALVTGANRGIGLAIVRTLVDAGAKVTMLVRDIDAGKRAAAAFGDNANVVHADVTSEREVQRAFEEARDAFGHVQVLVNNAGFAESAPVLRSDVALFERLMAVHLYGAVSCTRAALPGMFEGGFGRIVNIASTAGIAGHAYVSAYTAAKHALVGYTRSVAKEVLKRGVTVNAVCPGYTDTDLVTTNVDFIANRTGRTREESHALLLADTPLARLITPEEVAHAVRWLCDDLSGAVTGQAIIIDGGELS